MLNVIGYLVTSLVFGVIALVGYDFIESKTRLTIRGRRVLFVLGLIVGAGIYYFDSHIFWECSQTACGYTNKGR
jgi:xanthine/uracil permease